MNFTTANHTLSLTTLPISSTNITETTNDASLSGLKVFLALGGLAFTAVQQRSGADEFPCAFTPSLARLSPLICAADVLVAIITVLYGLGNGLGLGHSCALYVRNTRRHMADPIPPLDGCRSLLECIKSVPAILGAVVLFATKGIDVRIVVWTAMFLAAPICSAVMRIAAEYARGHGDVDDALPADSRKLILKISDWMWCAAYACQFTLWIQVFEAFSVLTLFPENNTECMIGMIGASIAIAILLSALCKRRFYMYWSLRNWEQKQVFVALNVGFVLVLVVGMPTNTESLAKWRNLFVYLGAFSVVVNMLWIVTLFDDVLYYLPEALRHRSWSGLPPRERPRAIPDRLETRINPLLSTAPEYWRKTLMFNFACCQIFYAALNFILIENSSLGTVPGWASAFGR